eukprot:TRINITY_DN18658_c0_g1_i1.p1 TRINITY_DN18658_c0_g1~~TRINITY_DN18658_c0_g1_i1.p1  ORF type:complete len:266 (+),score=74.53 TRINITY_DN18658_c0_g1_i1:85-882(+)
MCWSLEVSLAIFTFEAILLTVMFFRNWRYDRYIIPLLANATLAELIDATMWYDQKLESDMRAGDLSCGRANRTAAYVVYIVMPMQPMMLNWASSHMCYPSLKPVFHLALLLSFMHWLCWVVGVVLTEHWEYLAMTSETMTMLPEMWKGYIGPVTCGVVSESVHIKWLIKQSVFPFTPNGFSFYLVYFFPQLMMRPLHLRVFWVYMLGVFMPLLLFFQMGFEAASMWCLLAVQAHLWFFFMPYVIDYLESGEDKRELTAHSNKKAD